MDIVMRIAFVYVALTLAFRALGKRELSQLSPFELVTLLMIAEIVAPALTAGDESLTGALFGGATLLCLALINSVLTYMSRGFRRLVEAPPTVLVRHGQLIESTLHRDRVRPDEIYSEMHKAGIERLSQVKWGLLEPDGQMSFIRTDEKESRSSRRRQFHERGRPRAGALNKGRNLSRGAPALASMASTASRRAAVDHSPRVS